MPLSRREIESLAIQLEDPLAFAGLQLAIGIRCSIPEHEVRLFVSLTVDIFKRSRSQDAPHGLRATALNERIPYKGARLTEQGSLPDELQADAPCSTGYAK